MSVLRERIGWECQVLRQLRQEDRYARSDHVDACRAMEVCQLRMAELLRPVHMRKLQDQQGPRIARLGPGERKALEAGRHMG